jgi:hypothetical protein
MEKTMPIENTVRFRLGDICIEMCCQDADFMDKMRIRYEPFLDSRQPDFYIEFSLRNELTSSGVRELLNTCRPYLEDKHLFTKPQLIDCRVDWNQARLWVSTEKAIFYPAVDYKLMNITLRGIYHGIYKRRKNTRPDIYLIHGCGITDGQHCYLFTGPSGSGKTTVARLADGKQILNDETVLVGKDMEGYYLSGTPFDGGVSERSDNTSYLSAIFFLKHENGVSLRKLSKAETYYKFLAQVLDTTPLLETPGPDSVAERADLSTEVAKRVPAYELGFRPDTSFWEVVKHI